MHDAKGVVMVWECKGCRAKAVYLEYLYIAWDSFTNPSSLSDLEYLLTYACSVLFGKMVLMFDDRLRRLHHAIDKVRSLLSIRWWIIPHKWRESSVSALAHQVGVIGGYWSDLKYRS